MTDDRRRHTPRAKDATGADATGADRGVRCALKEWIARSSDLVLVHRNGQIVDANRALLTFLGHDAAAPVPRGSVLSLLAPDDHAAARDWVGVETGRALPATPLVTHLLRADGLPVRVEVTTAWLSYDGALAALTRCREISPRKELGARLVLADRLASIGQLAAGVSHEINNPLAYITANLEMALDAIADVDSPASVPDLVDLLREAREGARRVQQLVRDLKTFARGDEDRRTAVDVRRVMEAAINMSWNEIRHRARLVKQYAEVPTVDANEGRLGQVFLNLLINAAQALPVGNVEHHVIHVSIALNAERQVVVEVRDTGPGIPPEILGRLFEPFVTTKQPGVGTGLGLAICHEIVTEMGGQIGVTSDADQGTCIRVRLPAARPRKPSSGKMRSVAAPVARRGRVLVVDDDPLLRKMLQRVLSREHDVVAVADARTALTLIADNGPYDLVLSDLMMPEMSGVDFYETLLRANPAQAARVVFLTGGAFSPRERTFLAQLPERCLEKPIDPKLLRATAARHVR